MKAKEIFPAVYMLDGRLATKNLISGNPVYGEQIVRIEKEEYRMWNPYRSKLGAAIMSGLKEMPIAPGGSILYLGAATGTTTSHVSDIVGEKGVVYCVEFAPDSMHNLLKISETRENMVPVYSDARSPAQYKEYADIEKVDVVYEDVAQPDQADILIKNAKMYLKTGGYGMIAIKSQSIDVSKKPALVFEETIKRLSTAFDIIEKVDVSKYEKEHLFVVVKFKG